MATGRDRIQALIPEALAGDGPAVAHGAGLTWERVSSLGALLSTLAEDPPGTALLSFSVDGVDLPVVERVAEALTRSGGRLLLSAPGASLEQALAARRLGSGNLLHEPLRRDELEPEVRRSVEEGESVPLPELPPEEEEGGPGLVGSGPAMMKIVRAIAEVGDSPATVLITGESGTGKELVARALHWAGARRERPFVAINCAAIPEQLLESEFFGHERGAFTGAVAMKKGRFERANGGTLFLDEVGDMSLILQAKILRALEERVVERLGGEELLPVDVRLVTATNQDLEDRVEEGGFREDLYYRLAVVRIDIPPLRERLEDVEELALRFTAELARRYRRPLRGIERSALRLLGTHSWPGNVRELRNVMDRAVLASRDGVIRADDLPIGPGSPHLAPRMGAEAGGGYPPTFSLEAVERDHVARVLRFTDGAMGEAARILGIHRNTLTRRVEAYGLRGGGTDS